MALFHMNRKVIQRSAGKSVCKALSYMHRTKVRDDFLGKTYSYPLKDNETVQSRVYIPDEAPESIRELIANPDSDPEKAAANLAALVDRTENNFIDQRFRCPDARIYQKSRMQTGFTDVVALQKELSLDENQKILGDYIQKMYVSRGLLATSAIHFEKDNPHAHIFVSLRSLTPEGFSKYKDRDVLKKSSLNMCRETWANLNNKMFEELGHTVRITHKSYAARGIELFPTIHEGDARFVRFSEEYVENNKTINQDIQKRNESKLQKDPEAILTLVGSQYVRFKEEMISNEFNRYLVDNQKLVQSLTSKVLGSKELVTLPSSDSKEILYSTRSYLRSEMSLFDEAEKLSQSPRYGIQDSRLSKILGKDFSFLSSEQKDVSKSVTSSGGLGLIVGRAGTGKSTLLEAVARSYESQGYRVLGGAWSGAAAEDLGGKLKIESRSLLSWFKTWEGFEKKVDDPRRAGGFFRSGLFLDSYRQQMNHKSVFILDEAGTVDTEHLSYLLARAASVGAKVIAVGDVCQNTPIGPGEAFRALCEAYPPAQLNDIRRQRTDWMKQASQSLSQHNVAEALEAYERQERIQWVNVRESHLQPVKDYIHHHKDGYSQAILALRNEDVMEINLTLHRKLKEAGHLESQSFIYPVAIGKARRPIEFSVKDRIIFLRNDYKGKSVQTHSGKRKGITNGTLGTITRLHGERVDALLDDGRKVCFNPEVYPYFSHGYAMTIHKAQGKTFDRVYALLNSPMDAATTYVALSRHREDCSLYVPTDRYPNLHRLVPAISREVPFDFITKTKGSTQATEIVGAIKEFEDLRSKSAVLYQEASKAQYSNPSLPFYEQESFQKAQELKPRLKHLAKCLLKNWNAVRDSQHEVHLNRYSIEVLAGKRKNLLTNAEIRQLEDRRAKFKESHSRLSSQKQFYDRTEVLHKIQWMDIPRLMESYTSFVHNPRSSSKTLLAFSESGKGTSVQVSIKNGIPLAYNFKEGCGADLIGFLAYYSQKTYGTVCRELGEAYHLEKITSSEKTTRPSISKEVSKEGILDAIRSKQNVKQDEISKLQRFAAILKPAQGTLADKYLTLRGITAELPEDLKYHESRKYGPSLVAIARDWEGKVTALQHIKVDPNTSYKVKDGLSKISRGCVTGASVKLQGDQYKTKTIFLAEGVETALSLREAGVHGEIRATLGKSNLLNVALTAPSDHKLIFVADNDGNPWESDEYLIKCVQVLRQNERNVEVLFPRNMGAIVKCDFNDILREEKGLEKIRNIVHEFEPELLGTSKTFDFNQVRGR